MGKRKEDTDLHKGSNKSEMIENNNPYRHLRPEKHREKFADQYADGTGDLPGVDIFPARPQKR